MCATIEMLHTTFFLRFLNLGYILRPPTMTDLEIDNIAIVWKKTHGLGTQYENIEN